MTQEQTWRQTARRRRLEEWQDDYWLAIDALTDPSGVDWLVIEILDAAILRLGGSRQ